MLPTIGYSTAQAVWRSQRRRRISQARRLFVVRRAILPALRCPTFISAVTAIPGVVFVGGNDGSLHALASADGRKLWQFDTARQFATVNKVSGKGGALSVPGPTIVGGMLFIPSGYGIVGGNTGNVLLAFSK